MNKNLVALGAALAAFIVNRADDAEGFVIQGKIEEMIRDLKLAQKDKEITEEFESVMRVVKS